MESFIPEIFYGNYKDVVKNFRSIKTKSKSLERIQALYDQLCGSISSIDLHKNNYRIYLRNGYLNNIDHVKESYFLSLFAKYISEEVNDPEKEIREWYKKKALTDKWCQLSLLTNNSVIDFLFQDKDYAFAVLESINSNWDFYMSLGEVFCFVPWLETMDKYKKDNKYYFWEYNYALCKLIYNLTGESYECKELSEFPKIWGNIKKKYGKNFN